MQIFQCFNLTPLGRGLQHPPGLPAAFFTYPTLFGRLSGLLLPLKFNYYISPSLKVGSTGQVLQIKVTSSVNVQLWSNSWIVFEHVQLVRIYYD